MKSPSEVMLAMKCCVNGCDESCPYYDWRAGTIDCADRLIRDIYSYISKGVNLNEY